MGWASSALLTLLGQEDLCLEFEIIWGHLKTLKNWLNLKGLKTEFTVRSASTHHTGWVEAHGYFFLISAWLS